MKPFESALYPQFYWCHYADHPQLLYTVRDRVIASSDGEEVLQETFRLKTHGEATGFYREADGGMVSFAATPGYEMYRGLGWCVSGRWGQSNRT